MVGWSIEDECIVASDAGAQLTLQMSVLATTDVHVYAVAEREGAALAVARQTAYQRAVAACWSSCIEGDKLVPLSGGPPIVEGEAFGALLTPPADSAPSVAVSPPGSQTPLAQPGRVLLASVPPVSGGRPGEDGGATASAAVQRLQFEFPPGARLYTLFLTTEPLKPSL